MHRLTLLLCPVLLAIPLVLTGCHLFDKNTAMEHPEMTMPEPAAELAQFEPSLGDWVGEGTAKMMPGQPAARWTSKGSTKRVMNGHAIQEDVQIKFLDMDKPPMCWRTYYGWDANQKKLVAFSAGTEGKIEQSQLLTWVGNSKITADVVETDDGPMMKRAVMKFTKNNCEFTVEHTHADQPAMVVVEGTMRRTNKPYELSGADWQGSYAPTPEEMTKLHSIAGSYTMKGGWSAMPGAPMMDISGSETIAPVFGGHFLRAKITGDAAPEDPSGFTYDAVAYICWDADNECYSQFYVNNMGEIGHQELRWINDDHIVSMHAGVMHGMPQATRSILKLNETGAIQKASMHRLSSDHQPDKAFWGTYTRTNEAE